MLPPKSCLCASRRITEVVLLTIISYSAASARPLISGYVTCPPRLGPHSVQRQLWLAFTALLTYAMGIVLRFCHTIGRGSLRNLSTFYGLTGCGGRELAVIQSTLLRAIVDLGCEVPYPGLGNAVTNDQGGDRRGPWNYLRPEAYLCKQLLEFGGCGGCGETENIGR